MLTCPCVSSEWKTPPIHAVDVSALSSGTRAVAGAQQMAVRPQHRELLRAQHDVPVLGREEASTAAVGVALDMAPLAVEQRIELGVVEVERVEQRRGREEVRCADRGRPVGRPRPAAWLRAARARGRRRRDRSPRSRAGWSARSLPNEAERGRLARRRARRPRPAARPSRARAAAASTAGRRSAPAPVDRRGATGRAAAARRSRSRRRGPASRSRTTDGGRRPPGSGAPRAPCRARGCASGVWSMYWLT